MGGDGANQCAVTISPDPSLVANAGKIQIAWADYRTGGSTNYDIYTASSEDGISWSPNMKVNDDTLPNNFQIWRLSTQQP